MHHAERYDHHITAIQNARTFKIPQVQELAVRYEAKHPGWTGDFLMEALTVVIECRELLAYTYVASYALPDDYADRDLYQYLQGNLEAKTDQLNGFLTDFTEDSSDELSFKASVSATRKYFLRMSEAIERGLSTGYDVIQHPQSLAESSPSAKSPKWDWFGFLKRDKQ
ncbi:MAG: hypothetical protein Q8P67_05455 [archaeon]|nr:hypothetical protein [archaeon]